MKISLCMIVRNAAHHLEKTVLSCSGVFDELVIVDTGSTDGTQEIAQRLADVYEGFEWVDDFSKARQFSFSKATGDLLMWIDADDVLVGGHKLRGEIEKHFANGKVGALYLNYIYEKDRWGNVTTEHYRERVIRKGWHEWRGCLHEILVPLRDMDAMKLEGGCYGGCYVEHERGDIDEDKNPRLVRNRRILERELERTKEEPDPRTLFYYGNVLCESGEYISAIEQYQRYLKMSGWKEECYLARCRIGECLRKLGRFDDAILEDMTAIMEMPQYHTAYYGVADSYFFKKDWFKVLHWCKLAQSAKPLDNFIVRNPSVATYRPFLILHHAFFNVGLFKDALACVEKLLKYMPDEPTILKYREIYRKQLEDIEIYNAFKRLEDVLEKAGEAEKVRKLYECAPRCIHDFPDIALTLRKPRPEGKPVIILYCGPTAEMWGPDSLRKGIGGSEEAAIHMSRRLAAQGWHVEVYAYTETEGCVDGVWWYPWWAMKDDEECDVFISWRDPSAFDRPIRSKVNILWLHDLQTKEFYVPERLDKIDKVMVLSQFHRESVWYIPDEKIWITSNGIDVADFGALKNEPHRAVYASSPDRGLEVLLELWPEIRKQVPEAELDIYYGFTPTFDKMCEQHLHLARVKERILSMLDQPGVNYIGRIGQKELAEAFSRCGAWLYPTDFGEISCITAMKVQAAGCVPVTTGYAALEETQRYGPKVGESRVQSIKREECRKEFVRLAVSVLSGEKNWMGYAVWDKDEREKMAAWARETFSWDTVARKWTEMFKELLAKQPAML